MPDILIHLYVLDSYLSYVMTKACSYKSPALIPVIQAYCIAFCLISDYRYNADNSMSIIYYLILRVNCGFNA